MIGLRVGDRGGRFIARRMMLWWRIMVSKKTLDPRMLRAFAEAGATRRRKRRHEQRTTLYLVTLLCHKRLSTWQCPVSCETQHPRDSKRLLCSHRLLSSGPSVRAISVCPAHSHTSPDHFCPWTGTSIGKGNMFFFKMFVVCVNTLCYVTIFVIVFLSIFEVGKRS